MKAMACCADHKHMQAKPCCEAAKDGDAIAMLMTLAVDPQWAPAPPVRQSSDVWFMRPVVVGKSIVQGHYVVEHDNDRMARGEPCTHIYAFDDRSKPVVVFNGMHLERDRRDRRHDRIHCALRSP